MTFIDRFWIAVQVRTNFEKGVAAQLHNKGYEEFLPTYKVRVRSAHANETHLRELPLFPGYVFCRFSNRNRGSLIVTTPGVLRIVTTSGQPVPVPDHEIDALKQVINSGANVRPESYVQVGDKVRIITGPLVGLTGFLIRVADNHKLIISIDILSRSVAVTINIDDIEKIH